MPDWIPAPALLFLERFWGSLRMLLQETQRRSCLGNLWISAKDKPIVLDITRTNGIENAVGAVALMRRISLNRRGCVS